MYTNLFSFSATIRISKIFILRNIMALIDAVVKEMGTIGTKTPDEGILHRMAPTHWRRRTEVVINSVLCRAGTTRQVKVSDKVQLFGNFHCSSYGRKSLYMPKHCSLDMLIMYVLFPRCCC